MRTKDVFTIKFVGYSSRRIPLFGSFFVDLIDVGTKIHFLVHFSQDSNGTLEECLTN